MRYKSMSSSCLSNLRGTVLNKFIIVLYALHKIIQHPEVLLEGGRLVVLLESHKPLYQYVL